MNPQKWYVDTSVLVAYYTSSNDEAARKIIAKRIFSQASEAEDLELVTSHWTLTELTRTLVKSHHMDRQTVSGIVTDLIRRGRIEGAKITFVDVSARLDYDFEEMCADLQDGIIKYTIGFQDVLHTIIMKNNGLDTILTFDAGFREVDGLVVINIENQ